MAAGVFAAHGARSAPALVYGFPGTVLISVNDEVVHGIPGADGSRAATWSSSTSRWSAPATWPTRRARWSWRARRPRRCGWPAARSARSRRRSRWRRPDARCARLGARSSASVRGEGFTVIRGLTGHGIGRTIHEPPSVPNHFDPWQEDVLTDGLVLTIEPIICAGRDGGDAGRRRLDRPHARRQPGRAPRAHADHHPRPAGAADGRLRRRRPGEARALLSPSPSPAN